MSLKRYLLTLGGVIVAFGLTLPAKGAVTMSEKETNSIVEDIESAPAWASMTEENLKTEGPRLVIALSRLRSLDADNARKVVQELAARARGDSEVDVWSKIYVFNRLYFAVPVLVPMKEAKFFGGWAGLPVEDGNIDILYPLREISDGEWEIAQTFGGYSGPDYLAEKEFDYFLKEYGLRK